ncbi:MAG: glycosyltransferase family 4 protein, partial [Chthoniobacterales bacterium]|nr:glycosyltransferase family 4 protein [Chthoniobacterales bacterium]
HLVWDPSAPRAAGGAELQAALMARELAVRGHRAVLLGADTGQSDGAEWEGIRIRKAGRFETGGLGDTLRAWPRIHEVLKEEQPDFVVVYGWTSLLYALAQWRRIVPFKLVFVCALDAEIDGEFRRRNPLRGSFFHRGMQLADARLSITAEQADDFARQGMECAVTRLLLRGVSSAVPSEKPIDLLWVARCEDVKRPPLFLDLAESLPRARCRMICAPHDSGLFAATKQRAASLSNVEFVGGVAYRDIQREFDNAKVFVNTSSHEGVPNTFIHAGSGRAAIASLEIDPDNMFTQFAAGVMARGSFGILKSGVERLLGDADALERAADESARFVREWHDNSRNVDVFLGATIGA